MARRTDAENLALHGYRTLCIGVSMSIVSNGSLASAQASARRRASAHALEGMDVKPCVLPAVPTICLWAIRASRAPVNVGTFHTYFEGGHWGYKYFFAYVRSTDRVHRPPHRGLRRVPDGPPALLRRPSVRRHPQRVDTELYRPLEPGEERPSRGRRASSSWAVDTRNRLDVLQAARILQDEGRTSSCRWSATACCVRCTTTRPRSWRLGPDPWPGSLDRSARALPRGDGLRRALRPRLLRRGPARGDGRGDADRLRRQRRVPPGHPRRGAAAVPPATPKPSRPASPSSSTTRIGAATGASGAAPSRWSAVPGRRSPAGSRSST